jgi:hypothetical protein
VGGGRIDGRMDKWMEEWDEEWGNNGFGTTAGRRGGQMKERWTSVGKCGWVG